MIFTREEMWRVAVEQMGSYSVGPNDFNSIVLDGPEDVEELYKALQESHWRAVDLREKGIV